MSLGPPSDEHGRALDRTLPLAITDSLSVWLGNARAYRSGLEIGCFVSFAATGRDVSALHGGELTLRASSVDGAEEVALRPAPPLVGAAVMSASATRRSSGPREGISIALLDAETVDATWCQMLWITPLPARGDLRLAVSWDDAGFEDAFVELSARELRGSP